MKLLTIYILIFLVFLQVFSKAWILIAFKINQIEIAQTLCEKRAVKNNTCQGKCHLKQQLDKADQEETKQIPKNSLPEFEVSYYHQQPLSLFIEDTDIYSAKLAIDYERNLFAYDLIDNILHPPNLL